VTAYRAVEGPAAEPRRQPWQCPGAAEPSDARHGRQNHHIGSFGTALQRHPINTGAMRPSPPPVANFATVRIATSAGLWVWPVAAPSPKLRAKLMADTVAAETLIVGCRQCIQHQLLEQGQRAFFDRVEGGRPDGWRLHFFCLNPSALSVLRGVGVEEIGPG
jgi:hypothetical protein